MGSSARPETVTALFSDGVANRLLKSRPDHVDTHDTITLAVQWRNRDGAAAKKRLVPAKIKVVPAKNNLLPAGATQAAGAGSSGEGIGEQDSSAPKRQRAASPPAHRPTGSLYSSVGGAVHTSKDASAHSSPDGSLHSSEVELAPSSDGRPLHSSDAVPVPSFAGGSVGHAVYTASWIAPRSDVHSQQRWFYVGQAGARLSRSHGVQFTFRALRKLRSKCSVPGQLTRLGPYFHISSRGSSACTLSPVAPRSSTAEPYLSLTGLVSHP
jgi:hypothetical protein